MKVKLLSRVQLLATPWITAHQTAPSMGFSRQEDWSGLPLPCPQLARGNVNKNAPNLKEKIKKTKKKKKERKKPYIQERRLNYKSCKVLVTQPCLTLCNPMDCSLPGSSVHGISQARIRVGCHFLFGGIFPTQASMPKWTKLHLEQN